MNINNTNTNWDLINSKGSFKSCLLGQVLILMVLFIGNIQIGIGQNILDQPLSFADKDGLPDKKITTFSESQDGFIWIGTQGGLYKFDGVSFKSFLHNPEDETTIANNSILAISQNKKNNEIWVGHEKGISILHPTKQTFRHYPIGYKKIKGKRTSPKAVNAIVIDNSGSIWIGVKNNGIYKYNSNIDQFEFVKCPINNSKSKKLKCSFTTKQLHQDLLDSNKIWIASSKGLIKINKEKEQVEWAFNGQDSLDEQTFKREVSSLCQTSNGKIYLTIKRKGLWEFDPSTNTFSSIFKVMETPIDKRPDRWKYNDKAETEKPNEIKNIHLYDKNTFWIVARYGTYLYDHTIHKILDKKIYLKSLNNARINFVDSKKRIWADNGRQGLNLYHFSSTQSNTTAIFPSYNNIDASRIKPKKMAFDTARNKLYITTQTRNGLLVQDQLNKQWTYIPPDDFENGVSNQFQSRDLLLLKDGAILIVTPRKIYWYQPGMNDLKSHVIDVQPGYLSINNIIQDQSGTIWIAGLLGLYQLDFDRNDLDKFQPKLKEITNIDLSNGDIIEDKDGDIWVTGPYRMYVYLKEKKKLLNGLFDKRKHPGLKFISAESNGRVWFKYGKRQIAFTTKEDLKEKKITYFGTEEGLIKADIDYIHHHKEDLLIFSKYGVQKFNLKTFTFSRLSVVEALFEKPILHLIEQPNDHFIGLTKNGIVPFSPEDLKSNQENLLTYLSGFQITGIEQLINNDPKKKKTLSIKHNTDVFSLKFSALNFKRPRVSYQYQLKGFDQRWQSGVPGQYVIYKDVPGGDYDFLVRTVDLTGISDEGQVIAHIHIDTPWWETTWFRFSALALFLGSVYFIYQYRIKKIRKEEQQKSKIDKQLAEAEMSALRAQMNPHFIFNSLNSIDYYIINQDQETASDYLNRFSRLIRLTLQNSKSDKVTLKNDLDALKLYIELEQLRFDDAFEYELKIDPAIDLEKIKLPPMLIQPYVENAIWHGLMQNKGTKGALKISLDLDQNFLHCHIEDNGIGRDAARALKSKSGTRRKSFGMKITGDRLDLINSSSNQKATASIFDLKNADESAIGTRVELKIPFQ